MQRRGFPIESLPTELLLEIINYASLYRNKECMLNLCLVSQRFRDLACPLLFSRISLGGFTSRLRNRSTQLKALSKGNTKASALAKHLSIDYSSAFSNDRAKVLTPLEETMLRHLQTAIGSFRTITTMSWQIGRYEPLWVINSIINSLATIPTLKDICINLAEFSTCFVGENLVAFSNLHKICVRATNFSDDDGMGKVLAHCPALTDLDISFHINMSQLFQFVDQAGTSLSLENLRMDQVVVSPDYFKSAIHHFRSLQSLYLYRYSTSDSGLTIWDTLVKERIYVRNLATDIVDHSLLHYLSSFQGLRKFSSIATMNANTLMFGKQLQPVDILQAMIPHHAQSLTELEILVPVNEFLQYWNPPFSENIVSLLSSFNNLRCFGVQLQATSLPITTCAKIFPKLKRLILYTPEMCFYLQRPHVELSLPFSRNIHDVIAEHRFEELSFEIECERIIYKLHKDEITGTFAYKS